MVTTFVVLQNNWNTIMYMCTEGAPYSLQYPPEPPAGVEREIEAKEIVEVPSLPGFFCRKSHDTIVYLSSTWPCHQSEIENLSGAINQQ